MIEGEWFRGLFEVYNNNIDHEADDRGRMRRVRGFILCLLSAHKADGWEERGSFGSSFSVYNMDHKTGEREVGFGRFIVVYNGIHRAESKGKGEDLGFICCLQYANKAEGRGGARGIQYAQKAEGRGITRG